MHAVAMATVVSIGYCILVYVVVVRQSNSVLGVIRYISKTLHNKTTFVVTK